MYAVPERRLCFGKDMKATAESELEIETLTTYMVNVGGPTRPGRLGGPMLVRRADGHRHRRRPVASNRVDIEKAVKQGPHRACSRFETGGVAGVGLHVRRCQDSSGLSGLDASMTFCLVHQLLLHSQRPAPQGNHDCADLAVIEYARAAGAPALEAYPLDGTVSRSATSTGYASTFAMAGFFEIARSSRKDQSCAFNSCKRG